MSLETNFDLAIHIITKLRVFAGRPEVQLQLFVIVVALILAAIITRLLKQGTQEAVNRWIEQRLDRPFGVLARVIYRVVQMISFPIYALLLLGLFGRLMSIQGFISGLVTQFTWVLITVLIFQLGIAVLYLVFEEHEVKRYHYRLLLPLLIVIIVLQLLSDLVNLRDLAQLELVPFFGRPITLGALFIATVGLYFWTDAVHSIQDLIYRIITLRTSVDPGSTQATLTLFRYGLIILGILFALSQLRLDSTTVAAITGGLSVGVGFGLREILSNFISGLLLLFERSLQPGDVIEVDGELCVVEKFSIRATTVRTLNHVELVIPNQIFFTSPFKTYTGTEHRVRVPLIVKTDCAIDPRRVQSVLKETVLAHEHVLDEPEPTVFITDYGDNVATFQVNIWLDDPLLSPPTVSEVRVMIWDAFDEHNIALPTPEVEVHFSNRQPLRMAANGQTSEPEHQMLMAAS
ncbi:MAG: mechanosensitive ion channel domain-containing protein [Chloroflexota bacterium]